MPGCAHLRGSVRIGNHAIESATFCRGQLPREQNTPGKTAPPILISFSGFREPPFKVVVQRRVGIKIQRQFGRRQRKVDRATVRQSQLQAGRIGRHLIETAMVLVPQSRRIRWLRFAHMV
jgi:hypothetical protein